MPDPLSITPYPPLSILLLLLIVMVAGYLARYPAHQLILGVARGLRRLFRLLARYAATSARRTGAWTSEVALDRAVARAARQVEWEHDRLLTRMEEDLADVPALRRRLLEQLAELEETFRRSAERAPEPPAWGRITDALARLAEDHDGEVSRALADIRDSMAQYRADARDQYRHANHRRYLLLYRMMPRWRQVRRMLDDVQERMGRLQARMDGLRRRIAEHAALRDAGQETVSALISGAFWRFLAAGGALLVAAAAVAVLVSLVVTPMQTMLGGAELVDGVPTYIVATGILVFVQLVLGLLMVETLRGSDLFPALGNLEASLRRLLFWLGFGALLILSATGAVLHYTIGEAGVVASASAPLLGDNTLVLVLGNATHALMVLLLPFALALAAVPLAVFLRSARTILGVFVTLLLHLVAVVAHVAATVVLVAGRLTVQLYDLLIFLPLWLERELPRWPRGSMPRDGSRRRPARLPSPHGPEAATEETAASSQGRL